MYQLVQFCSAVYKHDLAIQNYKEAVRLKPDYPTAHRNLKEVLDEKSKGK
ncbi:MAG TPA: tetratricopeptide repeat protein [Planctomycetes bacterium]|nr:tetratricopeptide repeat protein [Planctomycetota bacterium]HIJ71337.1 tetratricopeptide repeat protein [Planctomycetota bacterium]